MVIARVRMREMVRVRVRVRERVREMVRGRVRMGRLRVLAWTWLLAPSGLFEVLVLECWRRAVGCACDDHGVWPVCVACVTLLGQLFVVLAVHSGASGLCQCRDCPSGLLREIGGDPACDLRAVEQS